MRKLSLYILFLMLFFCASCTKELKEFSGDSNLMSNLLVGKIQLDTKCSDGDESDQILLTDMPYVTENGDTLYISAYLSDMEQSVNADTKGAPVTSSLFGTYGDYTDFVTRVYPATGTSCYVSKRDDLGHDTYTMTGENVSYSASKWSYDNKYYWPRNNADYLYFLGIAPAAVWTDGHISNHESASSWNASTHKYSFTYQSIVGTPSGKYNGEEQYDLLVAYNKQNRSTYDSSVHIDFQHACVGVRFIMGDIFGNIASMKLQNFYNSATITLGEGTLEFTNHSSLADFRQEFDFETQAHSDLDPLDSTANRIKTFMVIPQKLINRGTDIPDADLVISMGNTLHPETLSFSELADPSKGGDVKLADWSTYAGKIITFRVSSEKANNVSVTVNDRVVGHVKDSIVIKNDGKSDIMIRLKLVGNWLNADGEVLAAWDEDEKFGIFDADNGFPTNLNNINWKKGSDGFYYYKKYLKSGKVVSENLFNSYEVKSKPVDATGTWQQGGVKMQITTMELAILVQAVVAEPTLTSFKAAWGDEMATWIGTPVSDE